MQLVFKGGYFGAADKLQKGKTHKQSSKHSGIRAITQADKHSILIAYIW
jgi:hypothetical protein